MLLYSKTDRTLVMQGEPVRSDTEPSSTLYAVRLGLVANHADPWPRPGTRLSSV